MLTAEARVRVSAWALAMRARVWTLAYSGIAMAARMPMMATTIMSSMRVKPRWLPSIFRFLCHRPIIVLSPPCQVWAGCLRPRYGSLAFLVTDNSTFGATPLQPHDSCQNGNTTRAAAHRRHQVTENKGRDNSCTAQEIPDEGIAVLRG